MESLRKWSGLGFFGDLEIIAPLVQLCFPKLLFSKKSLGSEKESLHI